MVLAYTEINIPQVSLWDNPGHCVYWECSGLFIFWRHLEAYQAPKHNIDKFFLYVLLVF